MRRDTTGGIGIGEASRALKRIGKSIGKKMARLPEGRYAIVLSSMVVAGTHRGAVRKFDVFGDPALAAAITEYSGHLDAALHGTDAVPRIEEFAAIPGNAEKRARKVRGLLRTAWAFHTNGTKFAGTKQMYKVVADNPEAGFEWWGRVTGGIPFSNKAADDSDASIKIMAYLAPIVHAQMLEEAV